MPESSWFQKLYPYRWQILFLLLGVLFVSIGIFIYTGDILSQPSIEVIEDTESPTDVNSTSQIVVEVSGSVTDPGVYKLSNGSRVDDALKAANDITDDADQDWIEKYVNKAAPVVDGQKIYIPAIGEQSKSESATMQQGGVQGATTFETGMQRKVNVNTASQSELESLWGIGPATAQNIIEQRIYSSTEELQSKGILKKNVYERNKDILTVY